MKQIIEKISILSLSLMLVSTFAVSPALPQMIDYFVWLAGLVDLVGKQPF